MTPSHATESNVQRLEMDLGETEMTVQPDPAHNIEAFRAARQWAAEHGHPQPDDRMLAAYGRVLLAEVDQLRAELDKARAGRQIAIELHDAASRAHLDALRELGKALAELADAEAQP